jgi:hypothetical protein
MMIAGWGGGLAGISVDYRSITEQAEHYVRTYFDTHGDDQLIYHNLYHTEQERLANMSFTRRRPWGRWKICGGMDQPAEADGVVCLLCRGDRWRDVAAKARVSVLIWSYRGGDS